MKKRQNPIKRRRKPRWGAAQRADADRRKTPFRNSSKAQQELLLDLMWSIWPELPAYGRKAAQFVDLLGYFSLKTQQTEKKVRAGGASSLPLILSPWDRVFKMSKTAGEFHRDTRGEAFFGDLQPALQHPCEVG